MSSPFSGSVAEEVVSNPDVLELLLAFGLHRLHFLMLALCKTTHGIYLLCCSPSVRAWRQNLALKRRAISAIVPIWNQFHTQGFKYLGPSPFMCDLIQPEQDLKCVSFYVSREGRSTNSQEFVFNVHSNSMKSGGVGPSSIRESHKVQEIMEHVSQICIDQWFRFKRGGIQDEQPLQSLLDCLQKGISHDVGRVLYTSLLSCKDPIQFSTEVANLLETHLKIVDYHVPLYQHSIQRLFNVINLPVSNNASMHMLEAKLTLSHAECKRITASLRKSCEKYPSRYAHSKTKCTRLQTADYEWDGFSPGEPAVADLTVSVRRESADHVLVVITELDRKTMPSRLPLTNYSQSLSSSCVSKLSAKNGLMMCTDAALRLFDC